MLNLVYFARLREALGLESEEVPLPQGVQDVEGLTQWLRNRGNVWETEFAPGKRVRVAVNLELAEQATRVGDGDEVAFFPPVTGG
ncbi:MAG TPA: molybdopterin converting factor subunit 1 [Burkholderiales bacterium]|nr:molybdopterin converting factor subunit 1 [Burkholderiales bacterium]HYA21248.1 molybdopterin converting factor subunit 1 [Burkholderiales bacterium]